MIYRSSPQRCTLCPATATVSACARCESLLCAAHTPIAGQRCELCEMDWIRAARPQRTVPRPLLVVLVLGWCATAFVMANGCYIPAIKWVGSAVFVGFTLAFLGATQGADLRVWLTRRRFLRERMMGPRPLAELPAASPTEGASRARRRPRMAGGSGQQRWKLQTLCR